MGLLKFDGVATSQEVSVESRGDWGTFFAASSKGLPSLPADARHLRKAPEKAPFGETIICTTSKMGHRRANLLDAASGLLYKPF